MLDAHIINTEGLFKKEIHYIIPTFQRRYVWSEDEQWDPFWENVKDVAENHLNNPTQSGDEGKAQSEAHFLGAVIIQDEQSNFREPTKKIVIDGQQRLTTLQLFLDAIQWVCENYDGLHFKQVAKILAKFVTNDNDIYDGKHIFKLWPSKFDQEVFRHVMDNELDVSDFETSRINQAHRFFQEKVKEWLQEEPEQTEVRIDALVGAATKMLQFVVIDLDAQTKPHIIFETLNARGTPLAQFELIKNYVVSESQEPDIWGDLDDEWWREEVRQGSLYRPRLDVLFDYWLEANDGLEVSPEKVFKTFSKHAGEQDVNRVMSKIRRDFENYHAYKKVEGRTSTEKIFHYHIDIMKADVITPILLLLLDAKPMVQTKTFTVLESFLVRRMICRYTAGSYSGLVMKLIKRLWREGPDKIDEITVKCLQEETAYRVKWPSDKEVEDALMEQPLYDRLTKGRLRLVLEGIEQQLRASKKIDDRELPKKLTIEHIMPKDWRDNWPLSEGTDKDERDKLVGTIGNLTLVTQSLNSSMSNASWEDKRRELQKYSLIMLNKELPSKSSWNEIDIKNRNRQMAKLISKRWPGPDAQEWNG